MDVNIKHAGKTHNVVLNPELPPLHFKEAIYQVTGVPVDRMKVMVKGGVLKDDTGWKKINPKAGQTFMVIGAAGELPKPPEKPITFLEDMEDSELAEALAMPVGLKNLGNTCYMNSTIQAIRAIPPLQLALNKATTTPPLVLTIRDLYNSMSRTTEPVVPYAFLTALRQVHPQFGEMDRSGGGGAPRGFAQQDAEEAYSQILNSLREVPDSDDPSKRFLDQWMAGEIQRVTKLEVDPSETPEPPTITSEKVMKLECHISINTNYMATGISNSLKTTLTKHSPSLGHDASYIQTTRLTRLPTYLTVHMVRFAWRADVGRKAKIMRKVKFPTTYDALEIVSDDLKDKLTKVNRRLVEIEKSRAERRKARMRRRGLAGGAEAQAMDVDDGEPEPVKRAKEREEIDNLVDPAIKADIGASWSGLYDLVAIVTHKGAAADSGHYIGFAKKSVFHDPSYSGAPVADMDINALDTIEADEDWYKFDDDKVSVFPKDKLGTLDGGGEDSSAYVLVYRSRFV
ncbi:uncharacterized protein EV420DRAFT_1310203 [Desarmillaria tabescens]|uniref:Ubiquitin carboxyl-terminal hydrolase n=1 Tax=Armillaria tabescens TaxID=1929756 RepID=A0AA39KAA6_ARMTA|nr:uncharacterized protein EV420DRAFT_1310203 [Desarmillaria tabescens]KAK0457163.1 hypothetical protein EV420DRAFT_1310203 [Desarmillaria tabescens]